MARPVRLFAGLVSENFKVSDHAEDKAGNKVSENTNENAVYYRITCKCGSTQRLAKWRLSQGHICKACSLAWIPEKPPLQPSKSSYTLLIGSDVYRGTLDVLTQNLPSTTIQTALKNGFKLYKFHGHEGISITTDRAEAMFKARLGKEGLVVLTKKDTDPMFTKDRHTPAENPTAPADTPQPPQVPQATPEPPPYTPPRTSPSHFEDAVQGILSDTPPWAVKP